MAGIPVDSEVDFDDREFFKCLRFNTILLKARCIERQERELEPFSSRGMLLRPSLSFLICKSCVQGKAVREELMRARPRRGKGVRNVECDFYDNCLDKAARADWQSFKCDECEQNGGNMEKPENTRICEECGEETTITPKHSLGPKCMATRKNGARSTAKGTVAGDSKNAGL